MPSTCDEHEEHDIVLEGWRKHVWKLVSLAMAVPFLAGAVHLVAHVVLPFFGIPCP